MVMLLTVMRQYSKEADWWGRQILLFGDVNLKHVLAVRGVGSSWK